MPDDAKQLADRFKPSTVLKLDPDRQIYRGRYGPCGKFLIGGALDATVRRWDATDPAALKPLTSLTGHHGWVSAIAFSPKGQWLFTADSWGALRCWPYAEADPQPRWAIDDAHDGWLRDIAVSPDGQTLATCGRDQLVRLFAAADGRLLHTFEGHHEDVYTVAFSPDGDTVASGDERGVVKLWSVKDKKHLRDLDARSLHKLDRLQEVGGLRVLMFTDEGKTLLAAGTTPTRGATVQGTPTILHFDVKTGELRHTFQIGKANDGHVEDLALHPQGFLVGVTSGTPGSGRLFFVRPADAAAFYDDTKLANSHAVALHPDAKRFAVFNTNNGSNGNGRKTDKDGNYVGNYSPVQVFEWNPA